MSKLFSFLSFAEWIIILFTISFAGSVFYLSQKVTHYVAENEKNKVNIFVEAIWVLSSPDMVNNMSTFLFLNKVVESNTDVPIIVLNESAEILSFKNIDSSLVDTPEKLEAQLSKMSAYQEPIERHISSDEPIYVYYYASPFLKLVMYAPIWQILTFLFTSLLGFFIVKQKRKSDSNKLWVGLAKETAHQLGTPVSALLGWIGVLEDNAVEPDVVEEMKKDVQVIQKVINRFSKIGSETILIPTDIYPLLLNSFEYIKNRASKKINFIFHTDFQSYILPLNVTLIPWVIENLLVNAIDAVSENGEILLEAEHKEKAVVIFVTDNGKGIPMKNIQKIFQPGFTTKNRGWGLGLSLCWRIITNYHGGKIEVVHSVIGKGTTIKITLYGEKK